MKLKTARAVNTGVLVIGSGGAGLRAAIAARKCAVDVLLVSESPAGFRTNTAISGATFAAAGIWKGEGDSPEVHSRDTVAGGRFINDRKLVDTLTTGATEQVTDLLEFGVKFIQRQGEFLIGKIPGHTYPRHVFIEATRGINLTRPLQHYASRLGVRFLEGVFITRLIRDGDTAIGALGLDRAGQVIAISAGATILATGGAGEIYLRTNNVTGATGDGYALAYALGATLRDMEFVQFYPTGWGKNGRKMCIYERFLPRGATLKNALNEDILKKHNIEDVNSATRDILTRIIMEEITEGRGIGEEVLLDFTTMPKASPEKLYQGKLRVAPTAHFFMGGVEINENGETGIGGLYAAGEVCGGVHGANRLGGNALIETLVFGDIAGSTAAARVAETGCTTIPCGEVAAEINRLNEMASGSGRSSLDKLKQSLKQTMWDRAGIIRNRQSLEDALKEILELQKESGTVSVSDYSQLVQAIKLANMLKVSEMVCRAALARTESRGAHYRTDYPQEDGHWQKTVRISRKGEKMVLEAIPVTG